MNWEKGKGEEGEKGRSTGNVLGERERKVRKEGTKEMDWQKGRGRAKKMDWEKGRGR